MDNARLRGLIGLTVRARQAVFGEDGCLKTIRAGNCGVLLAPFDALVLDEPFTGLDEENRSVAMACIRQEAAGKIVLLVTHEEAEAKMLGCEIIKL